MSKHERSNQGPQARFRVFRRPNGGLRITDESTDPDGTIIGRMWTTNTGKSRRGRVLLLEPQELKRKVRVQLTVEDDHQAQATITKELTVGARVEEKEAENLTTEVGSLGEDPVDADDEENKALQEEAVDEGKEAPPAG
jgi:hypothetical protein